MIRVVIVSPDRETFAEFASAFTEHEDTQLSWAASGETALELATDPPVDLVVADEILADMTGLELAEKLVRRNPMINCACVSRLSQGAFHEASEGLGLMPQLSPRPGKKEGEALLTTLKQWKGEL